MIRLRIRPAFTLIEILVAAAVFSLLFLVAATVFASVQTRQRDSLSRQRLVADGRYVLESIARTARLQRIDYAYYYTTANAEANVDTGPGSLGGTTNGSNTILVTRNSDDEQTCYRLNSSKIQVGKDCGGSATWTDLTASDLQITDFRIWINPRSNPYKATPKQTSDCRQNGGTNPSTYDSAGVCTCANAAGTAADVNKCYPGQRCIATSSTPAFVCQNSTQQPTVTIELSTQSKSGTATIKSTLQTTVVTRVYGK